MDRVFREYIHADHLQDSTHALVDSEGLIENGDHEVYAHCDPDLGFHGVLAQSVEGLDSQILLDPFEEELDLPACFVDLGYHDGVDFEIVGEEHQQLSGFGIQEANAPEIVRILLAGFGPVEANRLVAAQTAGLVHRSGLLDIVAHVPLGPGNEEGRGHTDSRKSCEVDVSTVHYVEGTGLEDYPIQSIDIVNLPLCDGDESRNRTPQVDHGMELDRRFLPSEPSPREEVHTQVYCRSVDCVNDLVDFCYVAVVTIQLAGLANENLRELEEDPPIPVLVGIGDIGSGDISSDSHGVKQPGLRCQARFDVPQTFSKRELRKDHAKQLVSG